ncbi:potassium-transporting ATPase subunit KdpC [Cryobacterium sp. PAMC25264]|uniref:potassium-transporting ATPase subunit KdpC n=1 Tax=Cryobacterium sp. PAMC25264 TaxID=2861288 RepID=UPI001C63290B|nr:potassium-transporting ATPase subunit KdpC [Cryobacterium sp. PAMC25264]QYF73997.1 potassium-transporting ATPase subunit KdpC [Cryobacterium sp. PAMC25264]
MSAPRSGIAHYWVALRAMLVLTVALGVAYPLVVTGIGQVALPAQANGSIETVDGDPVGSALIGQSFSDAEGNPLPEWFQPRPSAAGDGYDAGASSGSNYGPENADLIAAIKERKAQIAEFNGVSPDDIPADALTASSSGLDPHISPEYALLQVDRIAAARDLSADDVRALVEEHIQARDLGYLGEPTVNVLQLNIALEALQA